jgi:hypothetical protein
VLAHAALSLGWALVLAACLPRRQTLAWAVPAGLAIAALDLGVVGRRFARSVRWRSRRRSPITSPTR